MNILFISDTHGKHGYLDIPLDGIDMIIHAGDFSNSRDPHFNLNEAWEFIEWYDSLTWIEHKIFTAGNHETSFGHRLITKDEMPNSVTFLNHEFIEIGGLKIFGSPYTPSFGTGWAYNVDRKHIGQLWEDIPENLDVLITHGPPRGIMDLTRANYSLSKGDIYSDAYYQCGCESLRNEVYKKKPKYHVFGHLHNEPNVLNNGIVSGIQGCPTTFINASVVDLQHNFANEGKLIKL